MKGSEEYRAVRRRQLYLRQLGRPLLVRGEDHERAVRRLRSFHARGMTYTQMSRQSGLPSRTLAEAANGRTGMKRRTWEAVARLRFEEPDPHAWVSPVGTRRRLGALWTAGFPLAWLDGHLSFGSREYLQAIIRGKKGIAGVQYDTACEVAALYEKLAGQDPAGFGIEVRASRFAVAFAAKRACVPASCWDEDTIDDPESVPQWTGRCGTWIGARIHRREQIPMCGACAQADAGLALPGFRPEKLRLLRERRGLSRVAAGAAVGVHESTIKFWEEGRSVPERQWKIDKLLDVLDATFEDICESEES